MTQVESSFAMTPIPKITLRSGRLLMGFVLAVMVPVILIVLGVVIVRPSLGNWLSVLGMLVTLVPVVGIMVVIDRLSRGVADIRFEITETGLKIVSKLYGRLIPWETLQVAEARLIDFHKEWGYKPGRSSSRPSGLNLFGSCIGTYRLTNGQRALLFLVFPASKPAVWIPSSSKTSILISPNDPVAFLQALPVLKTDQVAAQPEPLA